jgi:antitoxin component of MazEF toxin-antitoxin module
VGSRRKETMERLEEHTDTLTPENNEFNASDQNTKGRTEIIN